jgi:hypothetical protein
MGFLVSDMASARWQNVTDSEPRLAVFFVRCPEPLGFSDGMPQFVPLGVRLEGYGEVSLHLNADGSSIGTLPAPTGLFVGLRFHTGKRVNSLFDSYMREGRSVVDSVIPESARETLTPAAEHRAESDAWSTFTMVELVTPLAEPGEDGVFRPAAPSDGAMVAAFEQCIEVLFMIIRAYRNTINTPLSTPTRERLGPEFFAVTRKAHASLDAWDATGAWVVNMTSVPNIQPPALDLSGLQLLGLGIEMEATAHPLASLTDIRSEASAALRNGDYRAAVMLYHTASEVELDITVMLMLWEEGVAPSDAVELFRKHLVGRVRSEFPPRLGGIWDNRNGSVVETWRRDLVLLRHGAVHGGFPVRPPQASAAKQAHDAMITHLFDRLVVNHKKYPKTASALLSLAAFERRGKKSKAIEATFQQLQGQELQEFNHWRAELTRLRSTL